MTSSTQNEEMPGDLSAKHARINPSKNFLSESMLHYILKNAPAKPYFKLIQTSKYFLLNEPPVISHFDCIKIEKNLAVYTADRGEIVSKVSGNKFGITTRNLKCESSFQSSFALSTFLLHVYHCNVESVYINDQILTYDELKLLIGAGNVKWFICWYNNFTHLNGDAVAIEDILLLMIPKIYFFHYISFVPYVFNHHKAAALPSFDRLHIGESNNKTSIFATRKM